MTALTDAYLSANKSMEGGTPRLIEPFAVFVATQSESAGIDVSLAALRAYLQSVAVDEPLRKELHLAIAGWDATMTGDWIDGTGAHTVGRRQRVYSLLGFDELTTDAMDAAFPQTGAGSVVISDEFEPWYTEERGAALEFYWRAYKKHLIDKGWDPDSISKLDIATTRVVERLSDPTAGVPIQGPGRRIRPKRQDGEFHRRPGQVDRRRLPPGHRSDGHDRPAT